MNALPAQAVLLLVGLAAAGFGLIAADRLLDERHRPPFRYGAFTFVAAAFFYALVRFCPDHYAAVDWTKGAVALTAALAVFYESYRQDRSRPIAEKWKRLVAVTLGVAAILTYFNGLQFGYAKYYHRWDQFHYYMGAKYFPELGYDGLYKCTAVAQDQMGVYTYVEEGTGRPLPLDMSKEVRHPDKKIRDLGGDNLLVSPRPVLDAPEQCLSLFSPERWRAFQSDVAFFRSTVDKGYWEDMQKDHGFNPPPVWILAGKLLADLHPASTGYQQWLASLDILLLAGMLGAIFWAFGARVFGVAAIFFGCQSAAPHAWTGGSFLRQDWLFFLVLSACLLRKRWFALAGAALMYSTLLRIFPGLCALGIAIVIGWQLIRRRTLTPPQKRTLAGMALAAAVLVPASVAVCGAGSYKAFYEHTLVVHDKTPLTNHMGLRVLVAQKRPFELRAVDLGFLGGGRVELPFQFGVGPESGRMKYTKDPSLGDPFLVWKTLRNERYAELRWVAYAIILACAAFFAAVLRRIKSLWVALCLAQIFVILLSQLTCYYYTFLILGALLAKVAPVRRSVELILFGLTLLSQVAWHVFTWNDDKYWVLTFLSLAACLLLIGRLAPANWAIFPRGPRPRQAAPHGPIQEEADR